MDGWSTRPAHSILNNNTYFVKQHVALLTKAFDILDPQREEVILECREGKLEFFTKARRIDLWLGIRKSAPFDVVIKTPAGEPVLRVKRGTSWHNASVEVLNEAGERIGGFKHKWWPLGRNFNVLNEAGETICFIDGSLLGREFTFRSSNDVQLAHISKKWVGLLKELFTFADNYSVEIKETVPPDNNMRALILAGALVIDLLIHD